MLTNKLNLPIEVFNALSKNRYSADSEESGKVTDFSVTTIISPIQQTILKRRHPDCNTEDVVDRVWSLFGHIAHFLLEEHGTEDSITEKRFYAEILGAIISGQVDHYKDRIITDYKTTSVYKIQKQSFDEWEQQLNMYAFLARRSGFDVDRIRIIAIIRDWQQSKVGTAGYPEAPIVEIDLNLWPYDMAERFVTNRVRLLINNSKIENKNLLLCSKEDMWMDASKFAVMKSGNTKATKLFDSEKEAQEYIVDTLKSDEKTYTVVERTAEPRRCLGYCPVSSVCVQHKTYLEGVENGKKVTGQGFASLTN